MSKPPPPAPSKTPAVRLSPQASPKRARSSSMTLPMPETPAPTLELPELPRCLYRERPDWRTGKFTAEQLFTAEQMRSYARAAVLQERERCAKLCERLGNSEYPQGL